ncbi:MAG: hypothetical protein P1Q69_02600 [Candidatus Thorarchaeota archaeon]|nr:hypothetical protein [Candidatus Thorarchaeota archaeon]
MARSLDEVMRFLENYTLAWHHWLMILALLKLGGNGSKAQIFPVYKKEGFSPHAIEDVFKSDLIELGEAVEVLDGIENLSNSTTIILSQDPKFQKFIKKNLKSVVNTFKIRKK